MFAIDSMRLSSVRTATSPVSTSVSVHLNSTVAFSLLPDDGDAEPDVAAYSLIVAPEPDGSPMDDSLYEPLHFTVVLFTLV